MNKKLFQTICFVMFLCITTTAQSYDQKGSINLFQQGMRAYGNTEYDIAATSFQKAIAKDPSNAQSYLYLGLCNVHMQSYTEAIENLNLAIKKDPSLAKNYNYLVGMGTAKAEVGEYRQAESLYRQALQQDKSKTEIYCMLAERVYQRENIDTIRAKELADSCFTHNPQAVNQVVRNAINLQRNGETHQAIAQYERIIEYVKNPSIVYNAALLNYKEKNFARAQALLHRTIQLAANDTSLLVKSYLTLGNINYQEVNYSDAIENYNNVLELEPNNVKAILGKGHTYYMLSDTQAAKKAFQEAADMGNPEGLEWIKYYENMQQQTDTLNNLEQRLDSMTPQK